MLRLVRIVIDDENTYTLKIIEVCNFRLQRKGTDLDRTVNRKVLPFLACSLR